MSQTKILKDMIQVLYVEYIDQLNNCGSNINSYTSDEVFDLLNDDTVDASLVSQLLEYGVRKGIFIRATSDFLNNQPFTYRINPEMLACNPANKKYLNSRCIYYPYATTAVVSSSSLCSPCPTALGSLQAGVCCKAPQDPYLTANVFYADSAGGRTNPGGC